VYYLPTNLPTKTLVIALLRFTSVYIKTLILFTFLFHWAEKSRGSGGGGGKRTSKPECSVSN
jgi:hypothetical protein